MMRVAVIHSNLGERKQVLVGGVVNHTGEGFPASDSLHFPKTAQPTAEGESARELGETSAGSHPGAEGRRGNDGGPSLDRQCDLSQAGRAQNENGKSRKASPGPGRRSGQVIPLLFGLVRAHSRTKKPKVHQAIVDRKGAERPLCGGGNGAKGLRAWQRDLGDTNCGACLVILARRIFGGGQFKATNKNFQTRRQGCPRYMTH
jgi:hypothetical protein